MKIIFGFNNITLVLINQGVQFFSLETVPFKIGDYIKFSKPALVYFRHNAYRDKIFKVTDVFYNPNPLSNIKHPNVVLMLDGMENTYCCSWFILIDRSIWSKL